MRPVSAEEQKRHKLIIKLQEQLSMIEAELKGTSYIGYFGLKLSIYSLASKFIDDSPNITGVSPYKVNF